MYFQHMQTGSRWVWQICSVPEDGLTSIQFNSKQVVSLYATTRIQATCRKM